MNIGSVVSDGYITQARTQLNDEISKTDNFQLQLEKAASEGKKKELMDACVNFESYFIQMMYKEMRKTVDTSGGILPKSSTEKIFEEMLDEEVSKNSAKAGGLGLANFMYKQLSMNMPSEE